MTVELGWEVDHETRDSWVSVLRNALRTGEVVPAPRGSYRGWHLVAEAIEAGGGFFVGIWEPGAPRPLGRPVPTPGNAPSILLILERFASGAVVGRDKCSPDLRADEQAVSTLLALLAHAAQALVLGEPPNPQNH